MVEELRLTFGGMKQSGVGPRNLSGHETLHFFTEPKNVCIAM